MAKKPQKELGGPRKMSLGMKIVVGIFAVIMALSMTLPSLTQIFAGSAASASSSSEQEAAQDSNNQSSSSESGSKEGENKAADDAKAQEGKDDPTANVPNNETLKNLADQNKDTVEKFNKRLEEDPKNLAALLNLGQTYMNWGSSATYSSTTDEEKAYSKALITKAEGFYDRYLELHDSDAARVQRIMCESYAGDNAKALEELQQLSAQKPDSPVVLVYLGMMYAQQGENQKAVETYKKVAEVDPDNEYGMADYAEQGIASVNSSQSSFNDLTNEKLLGTKSEPTEGLPGVIANKNDTSSQGNSGLVQTIQ